MMYPMLARAATGKVAHSPYPFRNPTVYPSVRPSVDSLTLLASAAADDLGRERAPPPHHNHKLISSHRRRRHGRRRNDARPSSGTSARVGSELLGEEGRKEGREPRRRSAGVGRRPTMEPNEGGRLRVEWCLSFTLSSRKLALKGERGKERNRPISSAAVRSLGRRN